MEQFIREKIKDKPLNKKRLAKKAGTAALCGVAFAVAASIVFAIFLPVINRQSKKASDGKNNNDVQTATQQSGIDDSSDAYSAAPTQDTNAIIPTNIRQLTNPIFFSFLNLIPGAGNYFLELFSSLWNRHKNLYKIFASRSFILFSNFISFSS